MTSNNENSNSKEEIIELNTYLKILGVATTGGQAKTIIRSSTLKLNGTVETRVKKKLQNGDTIEYKDKKYVVEF